MICPFLKQVLLIISIFLSISNYAFSQCSLDITLPEDITICESTNVELSALVSPIPDEVLWTGPNNFSSNNLNINPFVDDNSTFTFSAFVATDINLVLNGDFEAGDTGFSSGYLLGDIFCPFPQGPLWCEGMYSINDNPNNTHPNFASCEDHTSGNGNMLIANGSSTFIDVWCQNITVNPNTNYLFSAWATSVTSGSPAILQFTINGETIGDNFNVSTSTCDWGNFTAAWNSGDETSATICIENQNLAPSGNDFAIDDIGFLEVCEQEETVDVIISNVLGSLETSFTINCNNPFANLMVQPPMNNYMYEWGTQFGGTIAGSTSQAEATATTSGLYTVTITDEAGCSRTLSTTVNGSTDLPSTSIIGDFQIDCDENIVTVLSTNNDQNLIFEWENNSSTMPSANYSEAGNYTLTITNQFSCSSEIDFSITAIDPNIDYDLEVEDILSCIGDSTFISYSSAENTSIEWFHQDGNSLGTSNTLTVTDVGNYIIEIILDNGCTTTDTAVVFSQISQLDYILGESPIITCNTDQVSLNVSINSSFSEINWYNDSLIGSGEAILVDTAGMYTVEITDPNGCITRDTISVFDNFEIPTFATTSQEIDCALGVGSLSIVTDSVYSVEWELPDGSILSGDSINSTLQGEHIVTATNSIGCTSTETIELEGNQDFPILQVESENINCNNPFGFISTESNIDNTSISWVGPNGFTSEESELVINEPGNYIYEAISPLGCVSTDTVEIQGDLISPTLEILVSDTLDCNTENIGILVDSNSDFNIGNIISLNNYTVIDSLIIVDSPGIIAIEIIGENGCSSVDSIEIIADYTLPAAPQIGDFTLNCNNPDTTLTIDDDAGFTHLWFDSMNMVDGLSYFISEEGTYYLKKINNKTGCEIDVFFTVTSDIEAEIPDINSSSINCTDDVAFITISTTQNANFTSSNSDVTKINDFEYESSTSGVKDFIITYENGCTSAFNVEIEIDTISPILEASDYTFACMKEPLAVVVNYFIDKPSFSWDGPDGFTSTEEVIFTAISGIYTVTVADQDNGCSSEEEIEVFDNSTNIDLLLDVLQPQCFGELGELNELSFMGGTEPYTFQVTDEKDEEINSSELESGTYSIYVQDLLGCDTSFNFLIEDVFPFSVEAGKDTLINKGDGIDISAITDIEESEIQSILWTPDELLSCSNCLNPRIEELNEDTWFSVEITDINGCVEIDSILIRVQIDYSIYIPNIFSPDENGQNDNFSVFSNLAGGEVNILTFQIYDRWGNKVYEANDFYPNDTNIFWDGKYNGKPATQGVYSYFFLVKFPEGKEEIIKGTVTLMR